MKAGDLTASHVSEQSWTTVTTTEVDDVAYDLRVCGIGPEAFFEWIDEDGDPVTEVFDEIESIQDEVIRFKKLLAA